MMNVEDEAANGNSITKSVAVYDVITMLFHAFYYLGNSVNLATVAHSKNERSLPTY